MIVPHRLASVTRLSTLLALAAGASSARADVETAVFFNDQLFAYKILHMPDLDQRRAAAPGILGLPNDGSVHCAPTSTLNLMIYCANHGFPQVWPGPGNYQDDLYNVASLNDLALGISMNTGLPNGTGGQALFDGTKSWLTQSAPGRFTVHTYAASYKYAPRLTALAKSAIDGSIVSLCYGRYSVIGTFQGHDVLSRDGGHCVTLSRALRNGPDQTLAIRDPADSSDSWYSQSDFGNREVDVTDRTVAADFSSVQIRTMSSINYDVTKPKNAYIDRYVSIKPKLGYSWQPSPLTLSTAFKIIKVASFLGGPDAPGEHVFGVDGLVIDAVLAPEYTSVLMVLSPKSGGPTELHELDLLDGKVSKLATVPGARSLHLSRHRTLYVASPTLISLFDLDDKKVQSSVVPPFPVEALAYDDKADDLILLGSEAKKLARWHEGLTVIPCIFDLSSLIMGGSATVAVDPTDGEVFFATEKSPSIYGVTDVGTPQPIVKTWDLAGAPFPTALDLDDIGHLFAVSSGKLYEMAPSDPSTWQPVSTSPFAGMSVGGEFRVTRSRNNIDPVTMSGPTWRDLDPNELAGLIDAPFLPDCDAAPTNVPYGAGKAGTMGVPQLAALDLPTLGLPTAIHLKNGLPGAFPVLLLGLQSASLAFDGGLIHVVPTFVISIPAPIAADGTMTIAGTLPGDASLCGLTLYHQMLFADAGAPGYYHTALTNGLARTFGS